MLEPKLKRRYTWPVELLGVIVEDGEVIIGTEDQIFPNGEINEDFINLQHQQNIRGNCSTCTSPVATQVSHKTERVEIECETELETGEGVHDAGSCSQIGLLTEKNDSYPKNAARPVPSSSRKFAGSNYDSCVRDVNEKYGIFSPKIINVCSGKKQVVVDQHLTYGTCENDSTKQHHAHNESLQQDGNCNSFVGMHVQSDKNSASTSYIGTCPSDESGDDEHSNNEILQVQVSSLYPVTEEDNVFTHNNAGVTPTQTNIRREASRKVPGNINKLSQ